MDDKEEKIKIKKYKKKKKPDKNNRRNQPTSKISYGIRNILQYFRNVFTNDNNQELNVFKKIVIENNHKSKNKSLYKFKIKLIMSLTYN